MMDIGFYQYCIISEEYKYELLFQYFYENPKIQKLVENSEKAIIVKLQEIEKKIRKHIC